MQTTGTFSVQLNPLEQYPTQSEGTQLGRMSIDKTFTGGLTGSSQGEMLTAMGPEKGAAGYVAIEKFTGTLEGKSGSFALQHFGTMSGGQDRLILEVVPGSGTGALSALSGKMELKMEEGEHRYAFEYSI